MSIFRRLFGKSDDTPKATDSKSNVVGLEAKEKVDAALESATAVEGAAEAQASAPPPALVIPVTDGTTRPLAPETVISTQNEHIIFGQSTDVGMVRGNNQDAALTLFFASRSAEQRPDFGLFIVADGMGGHLDGEKASALTTRVVASQLTDEVYLPLLQQKIDADDNHSAHVETFSKAIQKANLDVIESVPDAGTTISAIMVIGHTAYITHVGDSRIYLITSETIEQITRDHSLVQRMIELDQLTPEEAAEHPQKNVLYRAIGQSDSLEVDTLFLRLIPNSRLLICSDGLWGQVPNQEMHEIVLSSTDPQEACDKLVALANTRGGLDNITTILLKIPGS